MSKNNKKMNAKRTLVSFLLIASVLVLIAAVSAAEPTVTIDSVSIGGINVDDASVIAGETITVKVVFTADDPTLADFDEASDVRVKVEIEGEKADVTEVTPLFDIVEGKTYVKKLVLKVPSDINENDKVDALDLDVKIWNSDSVETENSYVLGIQKPSYDLAIKSVMVSNTIPAGQSVPVDVVLKNVGYNNADDVYVTVSMPELNIAKSGYFGDIFALEDHDEEEFNTMSGRLNLEVPYTAKAGVYTLKVEVKNDETTSTATKEITIENSVSEIAMKSGNDLVVLNPTNQLKVYTVKYNSNDAVVVIPAVSSKTVPIEVPASGDYSFDVFVLSGESVLSTVKFSGSAAVKAEETQLTNPIFVLTVILAIVFLVLLVVLVVLITKKPQKTEEFGESYY